MRIDILTLFPKMFEGFLAKSLVGRAQEKGLVKIRVHSLRNWATDKHKTVDDRPFGGGPGMVLKPEPVWAAVQSLRVKRWGKKNTRVILMTPQGRVFNQEEAERLVKLKQLILICGHYEGVDERVRAALVDGEISIGDYVLTGGELPAAVITECVVRLIPGVVGKAESLRDESFSEGRLEYPQYTQPADFEGMKVPEILRSGNHREIEKWRKQMSEKRTRERRPDLWKKIKVRGAKYKTTA